MAYFQTLVKCSGDLPPKRSSHASFIYDHNLYVFGGFTRSNFLNDFYKLDLSNFEWQIIRAHNPPHPRCGHSINVYQTKVIVYGSFEPLDESVYEFDLVEQQWKKLKVLSETPLARAFHSAVVYGDEVYIYGGEMNNKILGDFWALNLKHYRWRSVVTEGESPNHRSGHSAVVYENKMILFGGHTDQYGDTSDLYEYNFETYKWRKMETSGIAPSPRHSHAATLCHDFMIIFGGWDGEHCSNEIFKLDLRTLKWHFIGFGPRLCSGTLECYRDRLLHFGGLDGQEVNNHVYDLSIPSETKQVWLSKQQNL